MRRINIWVWVFLITIPAFYSILRPGFFPMQDDLQAFRIHQMDKCIKDLQIPCRWVPDAGYQYGYPQFNYYPPGVYYLGEVFHLLGFQIIDSVKILFILGFLLSSFAMFLLLKTFLSNFSAFVGAALYTYVPYKAVEVYVRGAMSEFWSLVIFPLIFWSSLELIKTGKLKYIGFFASSVGLLLLTHNLMSMIFMPVVLIWIIAATALEKKWNFLPKVFIGVFLGVGLAAFFSLPVLFEKPFAHLETLLGGYFDYRQHFVDLYQLFVSNHWGYGSSYLGPGDDLSLTTGHVQWVLALIAALLALFHYKKNKKISILIIVLFFATLLVLFMMHMRSSFIWEKLPILYYLQFPWRFLAISIFLLSILSACAVHLLTDLKIKNVHLLIGISAVILSFILYANFFKPQKWIDISDNEKFSGLLWEKQLTISIFDYLPIYAKFPPVTKAPPLPETLEGEVEFTDYQKGSDYQIGEVYVTKKSTVRLPLFDFPGMTVFVDDKKIKHINNDCRGQNFCLGLITFDIPPGRHIIKAELKDTPIRSIGNALSLVSLLILVYLFYISFKYEKNTPSGRH